MSGIHSDDSWERDGELSCHDSDSWADAHSPFSPDSTTLWPGRSGGVGSELRQPHSTVTEPELLQVQSEASRRYSRDPVGNRRTCTSDALDSFEIRQVTDVDVLVRTFVGAKLFPEGAERAEKLSAKNARWKVLKQAVDEKYGELEPLEMARFERELGKMIDGRRNVETSRGLSRAAEGAEAKGLSPRGGSSRVEEEPEESQWEGAWRQKQEERWSSGAGDSAYF